MTYDAFEKHMHRLVTSASELARFRFAHDTIKLLHRAAEFAIEDYFADEEMELWVNMFANLDIQSTDELKARLKHLTIMAEERVDDSSEEYEIIDLLCAVDNWLEYRATRNPYFIERIAINMVNRLDDYIGGDSGAYSTDNMLGAPAMREEFHRQEHLLAGT